MDKEKVVVTLLLITIVLSLVSVVVTFSVGDREVNAEEVGRIDPDDSASVSLVVQAPETTGGAG